MSRNSPSDQPLLSGQNNLQALIPGIILVGLFGVLGVHARLRVRDANRDLTETTSKTCNVTNSTRSSPGIHNLFTEKTVVWEPWLSCLKRKVEQNWEPAQSGISRRTVVTFKVGKRGELRTVFLARSSGSKATDDAAMNAIQRSAPFEPLPAGFNGSQVQINFTFDVNVLGQMSGGVAGP